MIKKIFKNPMGHTSSSITKTFIGLTKRVSSHTVNTFWLKDRYIRTRDGRLRFRCKAAASVCVVALSMTVAPHVLHSHTTGSAESFALASMSPSLGVDKHAGDSIHPGFSMADAEAAAEKSERVASLVTRAHVIKAKPVKLDPVDMDLEINSGDTLAGSLQRAGVNAAESYSIVKAVSKHYDPRLIRPGQNVRIQMQPQNNELKLSKLELASDPIRTIVIEREKDGAFKSEIAEKEIVQEMAAARAEIKSSLYGSAAKNGVPDPIIAQAIKILSWSIDFQRDIKQGDTFEVLYDTFMTDDGQYVRSGEPYYIKLKQSGEEMAFYRHEFEGGRIGYFKADGHSAKKGLLSTPVDGARMSSGFGMRHHPVLGYSKMHKGTDFAAPTGTPIYAAGDGVIEKASRFGAYGNYVRIRHNDNIKTAYAHMSRFGKDVKSGSTVKQGEVIGYIGTTGRSTGPHLHYEVLLDGTQVNPNSVKIPTGEVLAGAELNKFKSTVASYEKQFKKLIGTLKFAFNMTEEADS
ncbi:MAG: peptidase M23 [Alphaproteobacteria bacterium]|nr:peptidase M23 [Alphaproteobacteria bacterium]